MKTLLLSLLLVSSAALAAGGNVHLDKANYDLSDKASLQRGAQLFMNYCLGCHSQQYQRYSRTFEDLGIPADLGQENLQFTGEKVTDYITNSMPAADAAEWFGAPPPDLTLVGRVRGADWIYTYLRSFYVDKDKKFGVNNVVFPNVGMPHVLLELQGVQALEEHDGHQQLTLVKAGSMSPAEYDQAVLDIVNYLRYTGEPFRLESERIGKYALIFVLIFGIFAYLLKKEFWRDVH